MKPPHEPRYDEIPGFNEGCCNDRERGCKKPDKDEAGAMTLPWARFLLNYLSRRRLPTRSGEGYPGANEVYWDNKIPYRRLAKEKAEDVEHIMPIIGEGERMDDGVVSDYHQHDYHGGADYPLSWETGRKGERPYSAREAETKEKRPGEEGEIRPDVEHLREMDGCNMVLLVSWRM